MIVKRREMGIADVQINISAAVILLVEFSGAQEGRGLHLELKDCRAGIGGQLRIRPPFAPEMGGRPQGIS